MKHEGEPQKKHDIMEAFLTEQDWKATFQNKYDGLFSQNMTLNRTLVEHALEIGGIDGAVFFTSGLTLRTRAPEVLPDIKRKRGKPNWKGTPKTTLFEAYPTNNGWNINVNDQDLFRKTPQFLSVEERKPLFAVELSRILAQGIEECIVKERLTGTKDPNFTTKVITSVLTTSAGIPAELLFDGSIRPREIPFMLALSLGLNLANNKWLRGQRISRSRIHQESKIESLLPPIEIDRVTRASFFLARNASHLVQLAE